MSAAQKKSSAMPEFLRRFFVALKRQPSIIALVFLLIAFFQYSLNLTHISDTTAKIQGAGMGLCGFATMLFSMLSLVCFLSAFPKRKKPVIAMVVLMFVMFAIIIFCDVHYSGLIVNALTRAENPIKLDASTIYIAQAYNVLQTHIVLCTPSFCARSTPPSPWKTTARWMSSTSPARTDRLFGTHITPGAPPPV